MAVFPFATHKEEASSDAPTSAGNIQTPAEKQDKKGHARPRRVLIAGAGAVGRSLAERLDAQSEYEVVGFLDDELALFGSKDWPILGPNRAATEIVQQYSIDDVFVAYAPTWQEKLLNDITQEGLQVRVQVVPSYYEAMRCSSRMDSIGDIAVLPFGAAGERVTDFTKRSFDVIAAFSGLILLSPFTLITAVLVALTSPGPILFAQERVGRGGKVFTLLKFRTMRRDAENATGPVLSAGKTDTRLTPIGRWLRKVRLDEVPQLVNVLRGEMSLVGPRPERPHFVEKFTARTPLYARRHEVRPGITGLAQTYGGYYTDARDKLRFDLFYVSHHSLLLDISILAQTLRKIFLRPDGC